LAAKLGAEIVCADSRQVYAGMAISTAQPSAADRARIAHHLYGALDPARDAMNAGRFTRDADALVDAIHARGKHAILVGGTGLYLRAWRVGLDEHSDMNALLARPPRRPAIWLLVDAALEVLEQRIRSRTQAMFAGGLVDEARALAHHLPAGHALLGTLGITEALALASGALDRDAATAQTGIRTRQYARRQRTWFKKEPWWSRLDGSSDALVDDAMATIEPSLRA
ncbi:MAG TPA: hypothetical protein VGO62_15015, partial [Myxococcota bacterium]